MGRGEEEFFKCCVVCPTGSGEASTLLERVIQLSPPISRDILESVKVRGLSPLDLSFPSASFITSGNHLTSYIQTGLGVILDLGHVIENLITLVFSSAI